jgi:hypothetical protein
MIVQVGGLCLLSGYDPQNQRMLYKIQQGQGGR